jgi:hypothetical protein
MTAASYAAATMVGAVTVAVMTPSPPPRIAEAPPEVAAPTPEETARVPALAPRVPGARLGDFAEMCWRATHFTLLVDAGGCRRQRADPQV